MERIDMAGTGERMKAVTGYLTVHDALSCAGLAAIGAVAVATAANPVAWGGVAAGLATSVSGNLATSVWQSLDRAGTGKLLSGWKGIDENHVVVQALRKAHIEALRSVNRAFRVGVRGATDRKILEDFADRVDAFAKIEWTASERLAFQRSDSLTPAEQSIREAVLNALPTNFGSALAQRRGADPPAELPRALVEGALAEIALRSLAPDEEVPWQFAALFRGDGEADSWFDLFVRKAAEFLKTEHAFEAIWNAEQQAYGQALLADVSDRVRILEQSLGVPIRRGDASVAKFKRAVRNRPTELLVARYRVVPYLDRGEVLKAAIGWARSTDGPDAQGRLYVGPGGFGKTRFAIELVLALLDEGWACTFLSERNTRNLPPGTLTSVVTGGGGAGRLVVLDYAESQIPLLRQVADIAGEADAGVPIRIVALARSPEGWWDGTRAEPGLVSTFEPRPHDLTDAALTGAERDTLYASGVAAFRDVLTTAGVKVSEATDSPEPLRRGFDRPLTVAMAAFLVASGAVLDASVSVFEQVFVEERRQWKRLLGAVVDNDPRVVALHRSAAQVTLVQGAVAAGVHALLAADRRTAAPGYATQDDIFSKLQLMYGVTLDQEMFIRPIEPDLLGEHAVMAALRGDVNELIDTTLATAAKGWPLFDGDVAAILAVLVRASRPEHDVATRATAGASISKLCSAVVTLDATAVRRVEGALPSFSIPLLDLALVIARRVVETSEDDEERARALNNFAARLSDTGRRSEAVTPARRALEIRETLARDNPAVYMPVLAGSLDNLANRLSETGHWDEALAPARRALEIRETLARANPVAYLPDLAVSLNNLARAVAAQVGS